ncbi:superoxide dismutase [Patescibacteria group bacterium AH-259-L05]|nr:superoxide dismutase [Patescibacteria group bacterium AH-259-L05]
MTYEAKNFDNLLGTEGFSDKALTTHFALYQGYVANTNKVAEQLQKLINEDKTATPEYGELKRRFGWEFNGMRLHEEYYFARMIKGGTELDKDSQFFKAITNSFGDYDKWEKDYKATGAIRGIGWAILYYDPKIQRLFNAWIDEHSLGHLAGGIPLLAMDIFEHAYIIDYGTNRADYMTAFLNAVNWNIVSEQFEIVLK